MKTTKVSGCPGCEMNHPSDASTHQHSVPQPDKFEIVKRAANFRRDRLLVKVQEVAADMASTAKKLETAAAMGDLARLVWLIREYNPTLATMLEQTHEDLHLIEGLSKA